MKSIADSNFGTKSLFVVVVFVVVLPLGSDNEITLICQESIIDSNFGTKSLFVVVIFVAVFVVWFCFRKW